MMTGYRTAQWKSINILYQPDKSRHEASQRPPWSKEWSIGSLPLKQLVWLQNKLQIFFSCAAAEHQGNQEIVWTRGQSSLDALYLDPMSLSISWIPTVHWIEKNCLVTSLWFWELRWFEENIFFQSFVGWRICIFHSWNNFVTLYRSIFFYACPSDRLAITSKSNLWIRESAVQFGFLNIWSLSKYQYLFSMLILPSWTIGKNPENLICPMG